jgi:hypothetical protein
VADKLEYQQGDVLLYKVSKIPEGATVIPKDKMRRGVVLALGEETGHAHVLHGGGCTLLEADGQRFLDVKEDSALVHEEHGPHTVKPGKYRVGRVREVDPFDEAVRSVRD